MDATITVPAELVSDIRSGLYTCLADAAEEVSGAAERRDLEHHPEWFDGTRVKFERAWALLDRIGWAESDRPEPLEIELDTHREALLDALEAMFLTEGDLGGSATVDTKPARRGDPSPSEATAERVSALRHFADSVGVDRRTQRS